MLTQDYYIHNTLRLSFINSHVYQTLPSIQTLNRDVMILGKLYNNQWQPKVDFEMQWTTFYRNVAPDTTFLLHAALGFCYLSAQLSNVPPYTVTQSYFGPMEKWMGKGGGITQHVRIHTTRRAAFNSRGHSLAGSALCFCVTMYISVAFSFKSPFFVVHGFESLVSHISSSVLQCSIGHLHTLPNPTCSRWYDHEWLKADYKPDSPPPPPHPQYSIGSNPTVSRNAVVHCSTESQNRRKTMPHWLEKLGRMNAIQASLLKIWQMHETHGLQVYSNPDEETSRKSYPDKSSGCKLCIESYFNGVSHGILDTPGVFIEEWDSPQGRRTSSYTYQTA